MQAIINKFLSAEDIGQSSIFNMIPVALSNVPFHRNTKSITRYFAKNFPLHLAVHEVSPVLVPPVQYTDPHIHQDTDEINIIISKKNLLYKIQLGDDEYTVSNNTSIWIPRGMIHAANVLSGSGYFITMRLN
jgi:hypothetical protein